MSRSRDDDAGRGASRGAADSAWEALFSNPLEALLDAAGAGIWVVDLRQHLLWQSRSQRRLHGLAPADGPQPFSLESCGARVHPDDRAAVAEGLARALAGERREYELRYRVVRADDGVVCNVRSVAMIERGADGTACRLIGIDEDVTAMTSAGRALQESEERLTLALAATGEGIFDWDIAGDTITHSPRCNELLGYDAAGERDPARRFLAALHPDDHDAFRAALQAHLDTGARFDHAYRYRHPELGWRWLRSRGEAIRDEAGRAVRLVGAIADVTEERRLRRIWEMTEQTAHVGGFEIDVATRMMRLSPGLSRLLGLPATRREALLDELLAAVPDEARRQASDTYEHAVAESAPYALETPFRRFDGAVVRLLVNGDVTNIGGQVVEVYGSVQDVTARRELEEQLLHAQKLESVGRLAGGIAHDFNNLLTAITSAESMIETDDPAVRRELGVIRAAAERATGLTRNLLTFARRDPVKVAPVQLDDIVRGVGTLLGKVVGETIELRVDLPAPVAPVLADRGRLEQVIVNLAVNARDAMPAGGVLSVRVRDVELDTAAAAHFEGIAPAAYVELSVCDTGHGIPPDVLPSVFEPFFTTRREQGGTGLGLSTCYGILRRFGGAIRARSEQGQGACFDVVLPRAEPAEETADAGAIPSRAETEADAAALDVLLVEDDGLVRSVVERLLRRMRHRVRVAEGAPAARALLAAASAPPDLLITDVVMPGGRGTDLAAELRERWPELPVLLISGYDDREHGRPVAVGGRSMLLRKPFTSTELRDAMAAVLGG